MKPFNLEAAKRGDPICTRCGDPVEFIGYSVQLPIESRVVVRVGEYVRTHYEDGAYYSGGEHPSDLFMAPQKRIVWVNFQPNSAGLSYYYDKQSDADKVAHPERIGGKAYPVEIEE